MPHPVPALAGRGRLALTEPELVAWGEQLGRSLRSPVLLAITGDLGAGKTTLVRAICRGYGVDEDVTSPTYALVHRYESKRGPVYHADLYRLDRPDELTNIGWDDLLREDAVMIVEWADHAGARLPANHIPLELDHIAEMPDRRVLYAGGHVGTPTGGTQHP